MFEENAARRVKDAAVSWLEQGAIQALNWECCPGFTAYAALAHQRLEHVIADGQPRILVVEYAADLFDVR